MLCAMLIEFCLFLFSVHIIRYCDHRIRLCDIMLMCFMCCNTGSFCLVTLSDFQLTIYVLSDCVILKSVFTVTIYQERYLC